MSNRFAALLNWRRAETALVAGSVVAGVVLRFVADSPVWLDEALSIEIASRDLGTIDDLLRHDGHPPLYYWLLHVWIEMFGDGATSARALSGVIGLAAWAAVVVLAHREGGARSARGAAVLMGLLPFAVRYSSEARMYSMVTLEVAIGWLAAGAAWRRPTLLRLIAVALSTAALLLTHYWSVYLLAVVGCAVLWHARPNGSHASTARRMVVAIGVGGLGFVPWLPAFLYQAAHTGTPWATPPRPTQVLAESGTGLAGGLFPESVLLAFVFVALATAGVAAGPRWARRVATVAVATMFVGSLAGLASNSAFQSRYAALIVPLAVLVVGAGVDGLGRLRLRVGVLTAVAVLSVGATLVELRNDRSQSAVVADVIAADAGAGDVVVTCPDQLGPALHRELSGTEVTVLGYPLLEPAPLVDWVDYADRHRSSDPDEVAARIAADLPVGASVWLYWNDSYRTLEGQCSALVEALAVTVGGVVARVAADPGTYFEHGNLVRFVSS